MKAPYRFGFTANWAHAPLAYWVHVPAAAGDGGHTPPAPTPVPHRGYPVLQVAIGRHELHFTSPAQLDHCIDVLARTPLPTSRQLSSRRGTGAGPNGHWLSRLPAALKAPRMRARVVKLLRRVRTDVVDAGNTRNFRLGRIHGD